VLAVRRPMGVRRSAANDAAGDCRRRAQTGCERAPARTVAVADTARAAGDARLDAHRWMNEGGGFDSEAAALFRAVP
jgi:hypothetical protein